MEELDIDQISTIIFDCDGVLVDSEPISCYALNVVFENNFGVNIGNNYTNVIGKSLDFALKYFADIHNIELRDISTLSKEKELLYFELARNKLETFPNIRTYLELLRNKGYKIAVASSGSLEKIKFSLDQVNLIEFFESRFSATQVKIGKPAPDLFLHTAKSIGSRVNECLVIEDSVPGIEAGLNARMPVIGFPSTLDCAVINKIGVPCAKNGYKSLIDLFS